MNVPASTRRGAVAALVAAAVVLFVLVGCGSTTFTAEGSRSPFPTPTPEPTPSPTPTPVPTVLPTPEPTVVPVVAGGADLDRPERGTRQFAVVPPSGGDELVPILAATDPAARAWPEDFGPLTAYVEAALGQPFRDEAPTISYVDKTGMVNQFAGSVPTLDQLDPQVAEAVRRFDDVHRALGIATTDFQVLQVNAATAGVIQGVYNDTSHTILIQADPARSVADQSIALQSVLVHEAVHAWQGRNGIRELAALATDQLVGGALIEGEADWVAGQWLAELSPAQAANYEATRSSAADAAPAVAQPSSLVAEVQMQYQLGARFYSIARTAPGGLRSASRSSTDSGVVNGGSLLDPWAWLDGSAPSHRLLPPANLSPSITALPSITPPINPVVWLQVFASVMPFDQALAAARQVTSTSPASAWVDADERTCIAVMLQADGTAPQLALDALDRWVGRLDAHRAVEPTLGGAIVTACDPGAGFVPEPVVAPDQAITITAAVLDVESQRRLTQPGSLPPACVAAIAAQVQALASESGRTAPEPDWVQIPEIAALTDCA